MRRTQIALVALMATVGIGLAILFMWPTGGCLSLTGFCPQPDASGNVAALVVDGAVVAALALYLVLSTAARLIRRS